MNKPSKSKAGHLSRAFDDGRLARIKDGDGIVHNPVPNPYTMNPEMFDWYQGYSYEDEQIGGRLAHNHRTVIFPSLLQSAENERRILRCAPPFDAQAEHEKDLEYESRVDYESWETDQPERQEDQ